jgi:hypothetical protein
VLVLGFKDREGLSGGETSVSNLKSPVGAKQREMGCSVESDRIYFKHQPTLYFADIMEEFLPCMRDSPSWFLEMRSSHRYLNNAGKLALNGSSWVEKLPSWKLEMRRESLCIDGFRLLDSFSRVCFPMFRNI